MQCFPEASSLLSVVGDAEIQESGVAISPDFQMDRKARVYPIALNLQGSIESSPLAGWQSGSGRIRIKPA
jgi:hypothetical protein